MRERYKMLLSAPVWVPLTLIAGTLHWICQGDSFKHQWAELKDIIKWAWRN